MTYLNRPASPKRLIPYLTLALLGVIAAACLAVLSYSAAAAQSPAPPTPTNLTHQANPVTHALSWDQGQLNRVSRYEVQIREIVDGIPWRDYCKEDPSFSPCQARQDGSAATSGSFHHFNPSVLDSLDYSIRLRAVGLDGQTSGWAYHTITELPEVVAPLDITARHRSDHIVVNWRHNHPGLPADRQIIRWKRADKTNWNQTVSTTTAAYRIASTTPGVSYVVEVANEYDRHTSRFAPHITKYTSKFGRATFQAPAAPTNLSRKVNPARLVISWDHDQPENVRHYEMQDRSVDPHSGPPDNSWTDYCPENYYNRQCPKPDTTRVVNNLYRNIQHRVRAVGFDGLTSDWATYDPLTELPANAAPLDIQARRDGGQIVVTWRHNHPDLPAERQIVRWRAENESDWTQIVSTTTATYTIATTTPRVGYVVEVANEYHKGSASRRSEFGRATFQPLSEPTSLSHQANPFRMVLSWDHDQPENVKHYEIQADAGGWRDYCPAPAPGISNQRPCPKPDTTRVFDIFPTGVTEDRIRVRAVGFDGQTSDWVTYTYEAVSMAPPLDIRARRDGGQIVVTWRHNNPNLPAERQIIRWRAGNESDWTQTVSTTTATYTIATTTPGVGYTVEVANEYDNEYPDTFESRSEFGRATFQPPAAPTNLSHQANPFRLVLSWDQDQPETVREYDVQTYVDAFGNPEWESHYCLQANLLARCPKTTTIGVSNFSVSTTTELVLKSRIRAAGFDGPKSDWVYYQAEMPKLAPPLDITALRDGDDIVVGWRHNHPKMPAPRQIVRWKAEDENEWNQHTVGPPAVSDRGEITQLYGNQVLWERRYPQAQSGEYHIPSVRSGVDYIVEVANEYDHYFPDSQSEARSGFGRAVFQPPPEPTNLEREVNPVRLVLSWDQDHPGSVASYEAEIQALNNGRWYLHCPYRGNGREVFQPFCPTPHGADYTLYTHVKVPFNLRIRAVGLDGLKSDWVVHTAQLPDLVPPPGLTARWDGGDIVASWQHNHPNLPAERHIVRWRAQDETNWTEAVVPTSEINQSSYRISGTRSGVGYIVEVANAYDDWADATLETMRSEFARVELSENPAFSPQLQTKGDAEVAPTVQFKSRERAVKERSDDDAKTLNVILDRPAPAVLTLNFTVHSDGSDVKLPPLPGRAEQGADFATEGLCEIKSSGVCSGSVTIPAGASEAAIVVNIIADGATEPAEVFKVRIDPGEGYTVGNKKTVRVTIRKNSK